MTAQRGSSSESAHLGRALEQLPQDAPLSEGRPQPQVPRSQPSCGASLIQGAEPLALSLMCQPILTSRT